MGQTIICEYLAAWEKTGVQPDPTDFGFDGLYAMLEECQEAMLNLGTVSNIKTATIERQIKRIDDLKQENHSLKQTIAVLEKNALPLDHMERAEYENWQRQEGDA